MKYKLIPVILTAAVTSVMTLSIVSHFQNNTPYFPVAANSEHRKEISYAALGSTGVASGPANFEAAAASSVKAVVHIKSTINGRTITTNSNDMFSRMFGQQQYYIPPQQESGSGVVISADGYIVTNNHVVSGVDEVAVTFNNRYTTKAKVVGINRTQSASAIESFIQTDAAVNPGNSGGALVNTSGQLIGINSAIASPTGSYAGYSYAIPANIVRKAVNDLTKYGTVQRAYMGVEFFNSAEATPEQITELGLDKTAGVYLTKVLPSSGAAKAGLRKGDFITEINGQIVNNEPELRGQIAHFQPGDNITVSYLREGKLSVTNVLLTNHSGTTEIVKAETTTKLLGASFRNLTSDERVKYNIVGGVVLTDPGKGDLAKHSQMQKGLILTNVNNSAVSSVSDLEQSVTGSRNLIIAGFYPGQTTVSYFQLNNIEDVTKGQ
jgi:serine protease Do